MYIRHSRYAVPGPRGAGTAAALAALARSPLDGYVRLAARYGDTVRIPFTAGRSFYLLSRPEHAEHVLAANQDNYVKALTTFLPLRALIGDGLVAQPRRPLRAPRAAVPAAVFPPSRGRVRPGHGCGGAADGCPLGPA